MKIGVLTLRLHTNYGGIMQAYALQTVLERMGHVVVVFNQNRKPIHYSLFRVILHFIYRCIYSIKHEKILKYYNINKELSETYKNYSTTIQFTQKFVDKYIHSLYMRSYVDGISHANIDCIVVGSDQIWDRSNGDSIDGSVANAYLPFLDNSIKRFSYAASFGHDDWQYSLEQTSIAQDAIKKFVGVSVREASGVKLCNDYLNCKAQKHIDPTMLLTAEDYISLLNLKDVRQSDGELLVYVIDSNKVKDSIANYVASTLVLKPFRVNSKAEDLNNMGVSLDEKVQPPVEYWLRGFLDAKFVVTDSFHACVFSILFHKPFIVIGNKERGLTRFINLLSKYSLENRLVENIDDVKNMDLFIPVDYTKIDGELKIARESAIDYLNENLSL